MAQGIYLKDRNGNDIEYGIPKKIEVPYEDNNGNMTTTFYTWLNTVRVYSIKNLKVLMKIDAIPTNECVMFGFSNADYEELGGDGVIFLLTTKSLKVGKTYDSIEDMI